MDKEIISGDEFNGPLGNVAQFVANYIESAPENNIYSFEPTANTCAGTSTNNGLQSVALDATATEYVYVSEELRRTYYGTINDHVELQNLLESWHLPDLLEFFERK